MPHKIIISIIKIMALIESLERAIILYLEKNNYNYIKLNNNDINSVHKFFLKY